MSLQARYHFFPIIFFPIEHQITWQCPASPFTTLRRHEMPTTGELANQNIKDRYYGLNDPVANKMLRQLSSSSDASAAAPPADQTITTLYVGGVTEVMTEQDLRSVFYPYGEIASVRVVAKSGCAFVTYGERGAAEKAAKKLSGKLIVKGVRLRLMVLRCFACVCCYFCAQHASARLHFF